MKSRIPWGLFILLIIWCILSFPRIIDPLFLPNPLAVLQEFFSVVKSGSLLRHTLATLYRLLIGFTIGTIIGVPTGLLMGYSHRIYNALEAIIEIFRSIPVIALFPLFLLLFGLGDNSKFAISAWSSSLIILINTMYGVHHSSKIRQMVARSMQASEWQIFRKVIFPDAMPEIVVGLRTGISIALIVVLMSEMFLGTTAGIGQMIYNAHLMYDIPSMYVWIILSGIIGYGINLALLSIEHHRIHWRIK